MILVNFFVVVVSNEKNNNLLHQNHRHLRKIGRLMVQAACLVCLISSVNGSSKKSLGEPALVAGT
jgi:hypothetical protein